jgi:predicted HicB family RNase H-like nuclease
MVFERLRGGFVRIRVGVAERLSADAKRRGVSLSALIASVLSDYAATA